VYAYTGGNPISRYDKDGRIFQWFWDDPVELSAHSNEAVTYCEFLNHIKGRSFEDVIHEFDRNPRGDLSAEGPDDRFRYVFDPADPKRVIDMRHFLVIGQMGEYSGLAVEIHQYITGEKGAFDAQDFFSNDLGVNWHVWYFWAGWRGFETSLRNFFNGRLPTDRKDCECK